jgi:hypothetical protein
MERAEPFVYLTTVVGSVAGHLVVGRLQAEGIAATTQGPGDGPYPFPAEIDVLVAASQLLRAREILLGDAVEATFDESRAGRPATRAASRGHGARKGRFRRR